MRVPDASSSLSLLTGARPDRSSVVALQILGLEVFSLGGCSVASSRGAASEFEGRGSRAMKSGPKAMLFFFVAPTRLPNPNRPEYKPPGNDFDPPSERQRQTLGGKNGPLRQGQPPDLEARNPLATPGPGSQPALRAWPQRV